MLGDAQVPAEGIREGEIEHWGDFVESLVSAAQKAEKSAGAKIGHVYYSVNDVRVESAWSTGSKVLEGEGEIQASDVRAAVRAAERMVGNFEKKIIYACETDYVIDDKDPVVDPVGIFGHKLDVKVHLLLISAERADHWNRCLNRAGFSHATPVLSGLASAWALFRPEERQRSRILWDLGKDFLNGLVLSSGKILEYRTLLSTASRWEDHRGVLLALCQEFKKNHPQVSEVVLTGERSQDARLLQELNQGLDVPCRRESGRPSIEGLLQVASEMEKRGIVPRLEKKVAGSTRDRIQAFVSDYF